MGNKSSLDIYSKVDAGDIDGLESELFDDEIDLLNDDGETLLFRACSIGNTAIVNLLIDRGADCSISCGDITCLHVSAGAHSPKVIQILIDKGCDVNAITLDGTTPLHCAIFSGDFIAAKLLIQSGASIENKDKNNLKPFDIPLSVNNYEIDGGLSETQIETLKSLSIKMNDFEENDYCDDVETMRLFFRDAGLGSKESREASTKAIECGCKTGKKLALLTFSGKINLTSLGLEDSDDIELLNFALKVSLPGIIPSKR